MKNVIKPFAKSVLIPLGLTAEAPAADVEMHKKILGSRTITQIISNEEMEEIMKIVKYLEDSDLLLKGVSETIQNEAKEQKAGFLSMLLGTLGASLLRNMITGKGIIIAGYSSKYLQSKKEKWIIRAGYESSERSLIKDLRFKKNF